MAQPSGNGRSGAYSMTNMANALPQQPGNFRPVGYPPVPQQQRFNSSTPSTAMMTPPMNTHYAPQHVMPMQSQHFYMPQQTHHFYGGPHSPMQQQTRPNIAFYPNHMALNQQHSQMTPAYFYPQHNANFQHHQAISQSIPSGQHYGGGEMISEHRTPSQSPTGDPAFRLQHVHGSKTGESGDENKAGIVRGPPRKPRQSGNLPPQTDLMNLVHHVCKEAPGLESLFLISKSNCAFANFKDEQTCIAAQQKLHDSKFQTVRLVSRLRKNTVEGTTGLAVPTGPAASAEPPTPHTPLSETIVDGTAKATTAGLDSKSPQVHDTEVSAHKDKFFILKSLTVEDLDLSVRTGIWATQSHNEDTLSNAFKAVDNVYLVFSANKSGEYFGYAKMVSPINEDPAAAIEFAPKAQSANDVDAPKSITTEATEHAPKGRIIDDSARGTIFWEAGREDGESADEEEESDASSGKGFDEVEASNKSWGKPFRLEWLSTTRLPFYRARGLRNPWNSNREVKIARDGTELEPSVGRKLIGLFNRAQSPIPMADGMRPGMAMMAGLSTISLLMDKHTIIVFILATATSTGIGQHHHDD
ncbi:hypothetical protein D7B24_006311 [Verticillium nonalfalfae]|uniref:YTH domain-containing protein n=1 Tax=Verticillium nonalfalfae TaxID=1051616 RepID=A0A3M9Y9W1_9PEZI|nr:uncharacterized protein D7B24_006311 [Verticillium nonalfalfae]RNJ57154.1 hypothetical protein D7B24_006311 [Verticillium nonalfalfae]